MTLPRTEAEHRSSAGYRDVLRVREFRVLWLAQVLSVLGDQVTRVALAAIVLARTGSVALSALVVATTFLPWLVAGPLLAVLADRCPRRTVMVVCDAGRGVLVATMAVPAVPVWGLFVLATLAALLGAPFEAARGATVPEVLTTEQYPVGQSLSVASLQLAQVLGFGAGGLLVAAASPQWALSVDAASFLLSASALRVWCVRRPGHGWTGRGPRAWLADSVEGAVLVARSPALRRLLALCCATACVAVVPEALAVAQARVYGSGPVVVASLCAVVPAGTAVGAVLVGRLVPPDRRLAWVRPLALVSAAAATGSLLQPSLPGLLALWFLVGVGAAGLLPANVAFVLAVDPSVGGRALSVAQVVLQTGQGTAIALAGVLAARASPSVAVGCAGLLGLGAVLVLSRPAPAGMSRPMRGPVVRSAAGPARRVRVLTVLVLMLAAGTWLLVGRHAAGPPGPLRLPWWVLLPLVTAAQAGLVHFQVRRQAQSVSLCHLPLAVGLVCCSPDAFVTARVVGGALAMAAVRGQRGIKLALNTAAYTLEAVVAVSLLSALGGWPVPAAVALVMVVADLTSFTVVGIAIMLFERRVDAAAWLRPLVWLLPINVATTSVALLATAALWRGVGYLPLLAAVTVASLLAYRAYGRLRNQHLDLGRLQELAETLPALTPTSPELPGVVERARLLLMAERADLWLGDGLVVQARQDHAPQSVAGGPVGAAPAEVRVDRWARRPGWSRLTSHLPDDQGHRHATLTAQDRLGAVRLFDRDDGRLLSAIATLIAGALDRGADRQHLLEAAGRDPLTGLWTLPEAARRLEGAYDRGERPALVVLDLIGLQDLNDSLGHDAGDTLLQVMARRLREAAGHGAVVARIGGDEMLAALSADGPTAGRVVAAVAGTVEIAGVPVELRIRSGRSAPRAPGTGSGATLLRQAQAALARARTDGTRDHTWSSALAVDPTRRFRLAGDLPAAVRHGQVVPVFQPLCRAGDHTVVGAEALARWRHPTLGPVPPDEFIAIAEQTGIIDELTATVLERALDQAAGWRAQDRPLRVSVNLSVRSLAEPDIVERVLDALRRHRLPPDALLLEITESSVMHDLRQAVRLLSRFQAEGIGIALDDFGTGHSSLAQLRVIPVDEVKLDRGFLSGIRGDPTARKIVATVVTLCHDLGRLVVAEGVEDAETALLLHHLGVDLLQGYYLGRPLPVSDWSAPPPPTLPHRLPRQADPTSSSRIEAVGRA